MVCKIIWYPTLTQKSCMKSVVDHAPWFYQVRWIIMTLTFAKIWSHHSTTSLGSVILIRRKLRTLIGKCTFPTNTLFCLRHLRIPQPNRIGPNACHATTQTLMQEWVWTVRAIWTGMEVLQVFNRSRPSWVPTRWCKSTRSTTQALHPLFLV